MTTHKAGTREEWIAARLELLAQEKELTKKNDELAARRRELPWVKLEKTYEFDTVEGRKALGDLFQGRSQLLVYHFMFGADYTAGCPSCSSIADGFNGILPHLVHHDVMFSAISRAPFAKLAAYEKRMGWTFPWASSAPGDFHTDFNVAFTREQQLEGSIEYNYRREQQWTVASIEKSSGSSPVDLLAATTGTNAATYTRERPGMSAFVREGDAIYHTYSAYSRGLDAMWGMYQWLDRAPLGRNEQGVWWKRHDEYGKAG